MQREQLHTVFAATFSAGDPAPISAESLSRAEVELQTLFPASFVAFATRVGAIFTPGILDLVTGGESEVAPPEASFDVQNFFTAEEIVETTRTYRVAGMDSWFVAIASDCMGNVFGFRQLTDSQRLYDAPVMVFEQYLLQPDRKAVSIHPRAHTLPPNEKQNSTRAQDPPATQKGQPARRNPPPRPKISSSNLMISKPPSVFLSAISKRAVFVPKSMAATLVFIPSSFPGSP